MTPNLDCHLPPTNDTADIGNLSCTLAVCRLRLLADRVARHYLDTQLLCPAHSRGAVHGWSRLFCFDTGIVALRNGRKQGVFCFNISWIAKVHELYWFRANVIMGPWCTLHMQHITSSHPIVCYTYVAFNAIKCILDIFITTSRHQTKSIECAIEAKWLGIPHQIRHI